MSLVCQSSLCTQHEWELVWTCGLQGGYFSRLWAAETGGGQTVSRGRQGEMTKLPLWRMDLKMDVKLVWIEKLKNCTFYLVFKCWGKCQGYKEGQNNRKWNLTRWNTPLLFKVCNWMNTFAWTTLHQEWLHGKGYKGKMGKINMWFTDLGQN